MKNVINVCIVTWLLTTSAFSQKIECFVIAPPQKNLSGVTKIAILDFKGQAGKGAAFTNYLATQILLEDRGIKDIEGFFSNKEGKTFMKGVKTSIFQLVDRTRISQILQEQNFRMTDYADASQAAIAGKLLGVDAIITGTVEYEGKDKTEEFTRKTKKGNVKKNYELTRTVTTNVSFKIISVETGEVLGNFDQQLKDKDSKMDEERSGIASNEAICDKNLKNLAPMCAAYFLPSFVYSKFEFKKVKSKEFKKQAEQAKDFLEKEDINRAFPFIKAIVDADPYNSEASYNLGLIYEMVGDYEKSFEALKNAYDLNSGEEDYAITFKRAEQNLQFGKALSAMGISFKSDFKSDASVLAKKVKTKGDKSDRFAVFTDPKEDSEVVTKIPGDTEFEIISTQGDFYKIKLLGGKEGWLHKSKTEN